MKDTLASENFLLAEKLRNEDPEQFYTLVRMHLSFVLDLSTDDCDGNSEKKCKALKWNLPFTKRQKPGTKNGVDSNNILHAEFFAQIKPVIEFLKKDENICQEGIFRRSGKVTRQQELKVLLHQGAELNFNNGMFSVHECATVLKNILSELPESVLTDAHYPAYCQIAEFFNGKNPNNKERLLRSLQLLILLLPYENRRFFQEIIELLNLAVHHEDKNRMSAENLATLFTPHLLCPRRLSPEALHTNSQVMSRVVAFMIQKGSELFEIPPTVATDVRAYWNKKERKNMSPLKQMNESVCDGTAANTVFTFIDREKTAEENRTNPTETALAQLYAYIQALPESSKKRKLIKQFNKENGYGTPLRTVASKKRIKTLNLGGSIKKHLSGFNKTTKRNINAGNTQGEYEEAFSPDSDKKNVENDEDIERSTNNINQFLHNENSSIHENNYCSSNNKHLITSLDDNSIPTLKEWSKRTNLCKSLEVLDCRTTSFNDFDDLPKSNESTSPGKTVKFICKRNSVAFQDSPRFKKTPRVKNTHDHPINLPISSLFPNEEHRYDPVSNTKNELCQNFDLSNESLNSDVKVEGKGKKSPGVKEECMNNMCKTPKQSGHFLTESLAEASSSNFWKTPIQKYNDIDIMANNCSFSSSNHTNRLPIVYGTKTSFLMTTSTPAQGNNCLMNPVVDKNNSMSPITKSARRMPKAMQETMMTPRSRKPVISLSGTDLCSLVGSNSQEEEENEFFISEPKTGNNLFKKLEDLNEEANDSLSSTFRNYLFSRSVLTASPVDLSFSSRTDDFMSVSERNSSDDDFKSLPEILNEAGLSESLLYCLDGNDPESCSSEHSNDKKKVGECSCSLSDCGNDVSRVYETAL